jgi:hypothetical protein
MPDVNSRPELASRGTFPGTRTANFPRVGHYSPAGPNLRRGSGEPGTPKDAERLPRRRISVGIVRGR